MEIDESIDSNRYSGTFRWKASKVLGNMPPIDKFMEADYSKGWMGYFLSRCADDIECAKLIKMVKSDLSIIDCLSTPVSIANMCNQLRLFNEGTVGRVHIVCIGCSDKAEERILLNTNCFNEICLGFPSVSRLDLYVVGPEISSSSSNIVEYLNSVRDRHTSDLHCHCFRGSTIQFFRSHPQLLCDNTIVVGLNCGFGNFENPMPKKFDLLLAWLDDLYFLTATRLPSFFCCANDYADLVGEVSVMQALCGAYFIAAPAENAFSYASTLVPEGNQERERETTDYSRGNSFWYAVQGHDKSRRYRFSDEESKLSQMLRVLAQYSQRPCEEFMKPAVGFPTNTGPTIGAVASSSGSTASSIYDDPHERSNLTVLQVEQLIENVSRSLVVTIVVPEGYVCNSIRDLGLQIGSSGTTLLLEAKPIVGLQVETTCIALQAQIMPLSGKAKLFKSSRRLVYSAAIV